MPDLDPEIEDHSEAVIEKEPLRDEPIKQVISSLLVEILPGKDGEEETRSPAKHIHMGDHEFAAPEQDPKLVGTAPPGATALRSQVRQPINLTQLSSALASAVPQRLKKPRDHQSTPAMRDAEKNDY